MVSIVNQGTEGVPSCRRQSVCEQCLQNAAIQPDNASSEGILTGLNKAVTVLRFRTYFNSD